MTSVISVLYISQNGSCEKDVNVRIKKARVVFGKMKKKDLDEH